MSQPLVFSMLFKVDAGPAKAALGAVQKGVADVGTEARKAKAAAEEQARGLDDLADAAGRAAAGQAELATRMRQSQMAVVPAGGAAEIARAASAVTGLRNFERTLGGVSTTAGDLRLAVAGLNREVAGAGESMIAAVTEARLWQGALDDIRASFNPLFAASRQYEGQLERIAEAEKLGAISAREAAAARQAAAATIAPAVGGRGAVAGGGNSYLTANLAAQGNDVMMMAIAGQNPLQLAVQQGTQVSQVLNGLEKGTSIPKALAAGFMSMVNPISLVTIGVIGLGAFGLQSLGKLIPPTKTLAATVNALETAVTSYEAASTRVRTADFAAEFGRSAEAARQLSVQMAEARRLAVELAATDVADGVSKSLNLDFWRDWQPMVQAKPQEMFGIGRFDHEGSQAAFAAQAAADEAASAQGLDAQIAALQKLLPLWDKAAKLRGGVTKQEAAGQTEIARALDNLLKQRALDDNAPGTARARELTEQLERRVELERAATQFGAQSVEVRAIETRHARATLTAELERAGVAKGSADWIAAMATQTRVVIGQQRAADQERATAQQEYFRGQQGSIDAINRERSLLGATAGERARINALAEAESDIHDRKLSLLGAQLARVLALGKAAAQAGLEQERAARALQAGIVDDRYGLAIGGARDPIETADLEGAREYARVMAETNDAQRASAEAARVRARSIGEAMVASRGEVMAMGDELAARQAIAAQVAAGSVSAADANRLLQLELQLRPLVAAAARAEGVEKQQLTQIILAQRIASEALAAEERRGEANDLLRSRAERIASMRIELALLGQSAETRARVLGLIEAERDIRRLGITGEAAQGLRDQAVEQARLTAEIERQGEAWKKVQTAGENAIDSVLGRLTKGDVKGALAELAQEASKLILELGVTNPLKNNLMGSNYATLDDVGGFKGIVGRLLGGGGINEAALVAQGAAAVQSMIVAATSVQLNAGAITWGPGAANLPFAPMAGAAAASGPVATGAPAQVAQQIWDFFTAKGLQAHQVAAIVGHAKAESGFNPLASGDGGDAKGLWQWNDRRPALYDFIGGQGNLGDVQAQLQYFWKEMMTTENASYRRLSAAPDVASATWAMQGFERPEGYKSGIYGSGMHWDKRLDGANQAMAQFGIAAQTATGQVVGVGPAFSQVGADAATTSHGFDALGQGMGQFGGALQQILGSAMNGNKGGVLSGLLGIGWKLIEGGMTKPGATPTTGFASGGFTGSGAPSQVAGIVHAGEYVFDAPSTARIGLNALEAIRRGRLPGYAAGGFVSARPANGPGMTAPRGGLEVGAAPMSFEPVMNFDMRGAMGGAELERSVRTAIGQAFRRYDEALPKKFARMRASPHRASL